MGSGTPVLCQSPQNTKGVDLCIIGTDTLVSGNSDLCRPSNFVGLINFSLGQKGVDKSSRKSISLEYEKGQTAIYEMKKQPETSKEGHAPLRRRSVLIECVKLFWGRVASWGEVVELWPRVLCVTFCEMSLRCQNKSNADKNFIACQKSERKKNEIQKYNRPRGVAVAFAARSVLYQKSRYFGTLVYWNLHDSSRNSQHRQVAAGGACGMWHGQEAGLVAGKWRQIYVKSNVCKCCLLAVK